MYYLWAERFYNWLPGQQTPQKYMDLRNLKVWGSNTLEMWTSDIIWTPEISTPEMSNVHPRKFEYRPQIKCGSQKRWLKYIFQGNRESTRATHGDPKSTDEKHDHQRLVQVEISDIWYWGCTYLTDSKINTCETGRKKWKQILQEWRSRRTESEWGW